MNRLRWSSILLVVFLILLGRVAIAEELSFDEAIDWGLENSYSIIELEYKIKRIEKKLEQNEAELGWQLDFLAEGDYKKETDFLGKRNKEKELDFNLKGSKLFSSGLKLEYKGVLKEEEPFNFDDADKRSDIMIGFSQRLYPWLPIALKRNREGILNQLIKAEEKLEREKINKEIEWIEEYLLVIRLNESLGLAEKNKTLAEENLQRVMNQKKVEEADDLQILVAETVLKKAKFELSQVQTKLTKVKEGLLQDLNLLGRGELQFSEDDRYFKKLGAYIKEREVDLSNKTDLMKWVRETHLEIRSNRLDEELMQKHRKWSKLERKPVMKLNGDYDYRSEDWNVGVKLSYNLADGGKKKSVTKSYEQELERIDKDYQNLLDKLYVELNDLIAQFEDTKLNLEEKNFAFEEKSLESLIFERQLEHGLIPETELEKKKIELGQAKVNLKMARDKVLIGRLKVMSFVGRI